MRTVSQMFPRVASLWTVGPGGRWCEPLSSQLSTRAAILWSVGPGGRRCELSSQPSSQLFLRERMIGWPRSLVVRALLGPFGPVLWPFGPAVSAPPPGPSGPPGAEAHNLMQLNPSQAFATWAIGCYPSRVMGLSPFLAASGPSGSSWGRLEAVGARRKAAWGQFGAVWVRFVYEKQPGPSER